MTRCKALYHTDVYTLYTPLTQTNDHEHIPPFFRGIILTSGLLLW